MPSYIIVHSDVAVVNSASNTAASSSDVSPFSPKASIDSSSSQKQLLSSLSTETANNTGSSKDPQRNLKCVSNILGQVKSMQRRLLNWVAEAPKDWAYECKLHIHLELALPPLPNFFSHKLNKLHEAFTCDMTAPWPFKFSNNALDFLGQTCQSLTMPFHSLVPWYLLASEWYLSKA